MTFDLFKAQLEQRKKLQLKLSDLKQRKAELTQSLAKKRAGNRLNSRQSDRKFKENRAKALSARNKRASKAAIHSIDQQIKSTQRQLNNIHSQLRNRPIGRLISRVEKIKQSLARSWKS